MSLPSRLTKPWAIEERWLRVITGIASRGKFEAAELAKAKAEWEARKASRPRLDEPGAIVEGTGGTLRIVGNVGVISIDGALFRHADLFTDISGGCSYDAIQRGLEAALASRQVQAILLRCNSPGGEADGVSELAAAIAKAREQKPVWAYVDNLCASAAYWLASQADHIVAEEASEAGSIGVRCAIIDDAEAMAAAGVREIQIVSSQSPSKRSAPVDDDVVQRIQVRIDDMADIFVAAVADGRGVTPAAVLEDFGQGGVMIAAKAKDAGLVDEIGNFTGTLEALGARVATNSAGRSALAAERKMKIESSARPTAADGGEWQCAGCNEMMGPSAKAYCAKCASDDDKDDDSDEDEAKALGLPAKAIASERRARMVGLVALEQRVFAATGATSADAAVGRIGAGAQALADVTAMRANVEKAQAAERQRELRVELERGLAGAPGKPARLSLGAIQKTVPVVLRGETKKSWLAAMDTLAAGADATKATITAPQILDAACSVAVSAEDLEAVREFIGASAPVAAPVAIEPARHGVTEAAELDALDQKITKAAAEARAVLDRNKPAAK